MYRSAVLHAVDVMTTEFLVEKGDGYAWLCGREDRRLAIGGGGGWFWEGDEDY